ncbi:uncharacterized protein DS421_5g160430 [Arachis hypogaea]|nr:uncharacterized protein DS421_5g160430 [Arachis hypogaea]
MAETRSLYRLNGVAHVAGSINEEPTRCIYSVWRQQNMPLHDRIVPYLERVGLYYLARLNTRWFWLDEPLVNAFIERWRPEMHTFHMPFGECTITLQDVAYQLGLTVDSLPVSGCLIDFEKLMEEGKPALGVLPDDAMEETVRIYARAYIMMLLSTQLFGDKSENRVHIWWLSFVARLDNMGSYSWESTAWVTYLPTSDRKEERVVQCRLALDCLGDRNIIWKPYASLDVMVVVHP